MASWGIIGFISGGVFVRYEMPSKKETDKVEKSVSALFTG